MSKNRPNQPPSYERESSSAPTPRRTSNARVRHLPGAARLVLSVLIAFHVTAVFLAPLSVPPSSQMVVEVSQRPPIQWYLDALYLNHGYHFFAPDPSMGHLIRYEVLDERGGIIKQGEFPNRREQSPRLLYHRYFMLADQSELPVPDEKIRDQWQRQYLAAYARQLLREYDGQTARVKRIVHYPLYRDDALRGMAIDDPRTYETQLEVTQTRRDLPIEGADQSSAWGGGQPSVSRQWQGAPR